MKNEVDLRFCIWGFEDISHDEISKYLGVEPFKVYIKGERKNINFPALSNENGWVLKSQKAIKSSFEDQLNAMLDIIETRIDHFADLSRKYYCELSCAIYIKCNNGENLPSIHLGSRYLECIKKVNMELDFDLYFLPNK